MRLVNLVLVVTALLCSTAVRLEFSQVSGSLKLEVSSHTGQDQHFSQATERSIPVEEEEVKESVSDSVDNFCHSTAPVIESDRVGWVADSHHELRIFLMLPRTVQ